MQQFLNNTKDVSLIFSIETHDTIFYYCVDVLFWKCDSYIGGADYSSVFLWKEEPGITDLDKVKNKFSSIKYYYIENCDREKFVKTVKEIEKTKRSRKTINLFFGVDKITYP